MLCSHFKERTEENENNKTQICSLEKELTKLKEVTKQQAEKISIGVGDSGVTEQDSPGQDVEKLTKENNDLQKALCKSAELLKDKTEVCDSQEKRNTALTLQISSLKEVITITKDLLNIRNMEVKHLQSDVDSMESKIAEERQRHNAMTGKLSDAVKLNSNLKQEYEMQLKIFQDLKSKYEEKVALLLRENQKLEQKLSNSALQPESVNSTVAPE